MYGSSYSDNKLGYEEDWTRIKRREAPAISIYFIRDDNNLPHHKLSCIYCKRTILDGVKGTIDKMVDGPVAGDEFDLAANIQCSLCGQRYRILGSVNLTKTEVQA